MKRSRPVSTEGGRKVKHVVRQFCKSSSVEIPDSALAEVRSLAQQVPEEKENKEKKREKTSFVRRLVFS